MKFSHVSVLLHESVDGLIGDRDGIYIDGTAGGGGHSEEILKKLSGKGRLIAIDRDAEAIEAAGKRLEGYGDRARLIRGNFMDMPALLKDAGIREANGILLDLGVSSHQIDDTERGFSYMAEDAPLDMRMDQSEARTAADIVNTYSEDELAGILREYGEERFAGSISKSIVKARNEKPLKTTGELNRAIERAIPAKQRHAGGHPSKRTFQAIRIELNGELSGLRDAINSMIDLLSPGGRICIITFHSLEDRIVKEAFRKNENPCTCPSTFPVCVCGKKPKGRVVTKKPILPSEEEMKINSRSKSAKLRIFEKKAD